ncbi:MAG: sulfotransferase [Planctomycetota bacterium]
MNQGIPTKQPAGKRAKLVDALRAPLLAKERNPASIAAAIDSIPPRFAQDAEVLFLKGMLFEAINRQDPALAAARAAHAKHPHPEALKLMARCLRRKGETDEAIRCAEQAEAGRPADTHSVVFKAGALEEAGRFDEATALLEPLIERAEKDSAPMHLGLRHEWAKLLVQNKRYAEALRYIDGIVGDEATPPPVHSIHLHLRAKACDRMKDYAGAIEAARKANEIGKVEFDPELYTEQVTALIDNWSRDSMASFPQSTCDSEVPVFVAGMPRSGTSLIDQIIDAHPKATGVGELNSIERFAVELSHAYNPDKPVNKRFGKFDSFRWTRAAKAYIKEITELAPEGAERIVNKALGNNKLVGLFARLFPNTRVIHAIRDPRDVAVSCYMGGFNNKMHAWTTQIDWVAHAWNQSMRMMDHWKQALDIPILDVHYERLVADPENEMPRIIEFLGLEWDDACRDFYKSKRTVRTLSYDQVNRPLYTSSSGRHKNFAPLLEGVEFPGYDPFAAR